MDKITAEKARIELTMILLYFSRFTDGNSFSDAKDYYAWKGYDFDTLNVLDDEDYIRQGERPSRRKSVYITETGISYARACLINSGMHK